MLRCKFVLLAPRSTNPTVAFLCCPTIPPIDILSESYIQYSNAPILEFVKTCISVNLESVRNRSCIFIPLIKRNIFIRGIIIWTISWALQMVCRLLSVALHKRLGTGTIRQTVLTNLVQDITSPSSKDTASAGYCSKIMTVHWHVTIVASLLPRRLWLPNSARAYPIGAHFTRQSRLHRHFL